MHSVRHAAGDAAAVVAAVAATVAGPGGSPDAFAQKAPLASILTAAASTLV